MTYKSRPIAKHSGPPLRRQSTRRLAERRPTCAAASPEPAKIDKTKVSVILVEGERVHRRAWIGPKRIFPEARRITIRWKLDLILLNPPKSHFFDTSSWGEFCDVTLSLKQAWQPDCAGWVKIDDYRCRQAFRHFVNLLNRAVYGSAFRRHGKRLRVLPVLEKGEIRARALRPWECGASGRWHVHCAIELPSHLDAIALENIIRECWAKVEWGYGRILVRDGANAGWIDYMLKDRQKSEFDGFLDCIIIESLHNPIADA